jgi:putative transposase
MSWLNENRKSGKVFDAIQIDERQIRSHLDALVKSSVEETLNGLLDAEADSLCGAGKYERSPERVDMRSGSYSRRLLRKQAK